MTRACPLGAAGCAGCPPPDDGPLRAALAIWALAALVVIAALLSGCTMDRAVHAANVQRAVGHAAAQVIAEVCTAGYDAAQTREDVERLDDLGCPAAAHALATYRAAHGAVVATLHAIDAGRCTSLVSQAPRECNLTAAGLDVVRAGAELAAAIDRLRPAPAAGTYSGAGGRSGGAGASGGPK